MKGDVDQDTDPPFPPELSEGSHDSPRLQMRGAAWLLASWKRRPGDPWAELSCVSSHPAGPVRKSQPAHTEPRKPSPEKVALI